MKNDNNPSNFFTEMFIYVRSLGGEYKRNLIKSLFRLKSALAQESIETKEMLEIYFRFTHGKASSDDMARANAQFRDLIKTSGLGVFAVLPFAPVTIPLIVKIGRHFGIEILPSAFQDNQEEKK